MEELYPNLVKVKEVSLESPFADAETMSIGDWLDPLQYLVAMSGQVVEPERLKNNLLGTKTSL